MPVALEFTNITKEYRQFSRRPLLRALDDFSLQVEAGEIFGFLGPNGAGKTTAIHLAMGFMLPSSGSGRLLDRPFGDTRTRSRVGFLPENIALYHRSAESLVRFYGALNHLRGSRLESRTREALEAVGLQPDSQRNAGKFSRGMAQRLGLAQALVNDPELLILDEPTSALDPLARVGVRELILAARNSGKTVFLSSHLLSEVELVCDRVGVLHKGKLVRLGSIASLLESSQQAEILARGISPDAFAGAVAKNGAISFLVSAHSQRAALERVWELGGEIICVNPARRSLESVFLELTAADGPQAPS